MSIYSHLAQSKFIQPTHECVKWTECNGFKHPNSDCDFKISREPWPLICNIFSQSHIINFESTLKTDN